MTYQITKVVGFLAHQSSNTQIVREISLCIIIQTLQGCV